MPTRELAPSSPEGLGSQGVTFAPLQQVPPVAAPLQAGCFEGTVQTQATSLLALILISYALEVTQLSLPCSGHVRVWPCSMPHQGEVEVG